MAVITISRQFGCGGTEIAELVCQRLKYAYVDKQIIAQAAREAGLPAGVDVEFEEHHSQLRSFVDRLLHPGPHVVAQVTVHNGGTSSAAVEELDNAEALNLIRSAIHAAYQAGNAVIVGRGGQAVLQNMPGVLHVRMVAPMPYRLLHIQAREGIDVEAALALATKKDRQSAGYLKEVFGIDWNDPLLYHMVVNTARWEPSAAAQAIVEAVRAVESTAQFAS